MSGWMDRLPEVRGCLRRNVPLAALTWLRVGGPAELVFQPADADDLAAFLAVLPAPVPVLPIGVASNLLVRDGGVEGVVVRFGGPLARVEVTGDLVLAGAGALDQRVAQEAQRAGLAGLEFLIGIPGTIGGAVRMNAGAFGGETRDRLVWAEALDRSGRLHRLDNTDLGFAYRRSALPRDWIVVRAAFRGTPADPAAVLARMEAIRIEQELKNLRDEQARLDEILGSPAALKRTLIREIEADAKAFGDKRRTVIEESEKAAIETPIVDEPVTVIFSRKGWVRARQGWEVDPATLSFKEGDELLALIKCRTVDPVAFLDSKGRAYSVEASQLPPARGDGVPASSLVEVQDGAHIMYCVAGRPETHIPIAAPFR